MSGRPNGIGLSMNSDGSPHWFVRPIDRTVDQIWDAVREAINQGMTPQEFKREVSEAWQYHLEADAKAALQELRKS